MKIVSNLYSLEIHEINASFGLQLRPQRLRLLQLRPLRQPHFVVAAYPLYCAFAKVELCPPFHLTGKHHFVVVVVVAEAAGTEAEAVGEAGDSCDEDQSCLNYVNSSPLDSNSGCHRVFSVPVR